MSVKLIDFDNDRQLDLFVTNMHADMWERRNDPLGTLDKVRPPPDVMPESYLRSRSPGHNILGNALFRKQSDLKYEDVALKTGAETYWPWGVSTGDLNADGFQDAFIASCMNYPFRYHVNSLLLNDGGRK